VPARALFSSRQWPEGFEFPACVPCNRATRRDEQIVAMLTRIFPDATTPKEADEVREAIRAVAHNAREILREMQPTLHQLRNAAQQIGRDANLPSYQLPVLSLQGPLVNASVENVARKLFLALYYKHAKAVLPKTAGVLFQWYSNLQPEFDTVPEELSFILSGVPRLERSRMNLDDQFFYRWGFAEGEASWAFVASFRRSFVLLGYIRLDGVFDFPTNGARVLKPFDWPCREPLK